MKAINFLNKKKDFLTIILPFLLFIFFWDVKPDCIRLENCVKDIRLLNFSIGSLFQFEHFQLRYIIVIPFIRLLLSKNFISILKSLYFPFLVIVHLIIVKLITGNPYTIRDFLSIILLVIVFTTVYNYKLIIIKNFHQIIKYFVIIFVILFSLYFSLFFPRLVLNCYNGWFSQTKFLFLENSHFALMSVPTIVYYNLYFLNLKNLNIKNNFELWLYVLFLIFSFINFSTTFLGGIILINFLLIIFYLFRFKNKNKKKIILTSIIFIIVSSLTVSFKSECKKRSYDFIIGSEKYMPIVMENIKNYMGCLYEKNILGEDSCELNKSIGIYKTYVDATNNHNFSIEVLITSLNISRMSLFDEPIGYGFNNYNFAHKNYVHQVARAHETLLKANVFDAASNVPKIITEFGFLGVFFLLYLGYLFIKNQKDDPINIFVMSVVVLQLIRGVGYFNGGFILFMILSYYLLKKT